MTPERIEIAEKFGAELEGLTSGIKTLRSERNRAAAASFCIALDHHAAIVFLMKNTFYSTSFALVRLLFEAYLRGLWLRHCASDAQISNFFNGAEPPKTMIAEIEATEAFNSGALSRIKKDHWNAMCDFTHTGGLHLQRWQSQDSIEPKFSSEDLERCLNCAESIGAMAALELVQLGVPDDDGRTVYQLIKKRWGDSDTLIG